MTRIVCRLAISMISVCLSGCLGGFRVAATPAQATPAFRPEQFFTGVTHGDGTLAVRGRADRAFQVVSTGRTDRDGSFVLDQTVTYANGAVNRRSFRMRRVDEHEYTGTLTGVAGAVSARVDGNSFHVRYTMRRPAVRMEQWIHLQPDGRTALNRATVRMFGIPVAHLSETITRQ